MHCGGNNGTDVSQTGETTCRVSNCPLRIGIGDQTALAADHLGHSPRVADRHEASALALPISRHQNIDRCGARRPDPMAPECRRAGQNAAGTRVQQCGNLLLRQTRASGYCQVDAGKQPLPRPARADPMLKRPPGHAAVKCLPARDDVPLRTQRGCQRDLVKSLRARHASQGYIPVRQMAPRPGHVRAGALGPRGQVWPKAPRSQPEPGGMPRSTGQRNAGRPQRASQRNAGQRNAGRPQRASCNRRQRSRTPVQGKSVDARKHGGRQPAGARRRPRVQAESAGGKCRPRVQAESVQVVAQHLGPGRVAEL